eukprot:TRINITY_DN19234_c0_g1_i1.p1 TRINITY_DN19234_c0_g1~~TRINITY_DN19234_c0_g1_i1.p1  ORF type:complete len:157 (-),score=58.73 TRINITY_DN19234_c0_g1_i1:46-516(-)
MNVIFLCDIICFFFFFQAEDGIRDLVRSRGLGDVYKRQGYRWQHSEGIAGKEDNSTRVTSHLSLIPISNVVDWVAHPAVLGLVGVFKGRCAIRVTGDVLQQGVGPNGPEDLRLVVFSQVDGLSIATCLLYTSDAADDLLCVDLGGRRIIKKKKSHV